MKLTNDCYDWNLCPQNIDIYGIAYSLIAKETINVGTSPSGKWWIRFVSVEVKICPLGERGVVLHDLDNFFDGHQLWSYILSLDLRIFYWFSKTFTKFINVLIRFPCPGSTIIGKEPWNLKE